MPPFRLYVLLPIFVFGRVIILHRPYFLRRERVPLEATGRDDRDGLVSRFPTQPVRDVKDYRVAD